jgi:hypothetical protein
MRRHLPKKQDTDTAMETHVPVWKAEFPDDQVRYAWQKKDIQPLNVDHDALSS